MLEYNKQKALFLPLTLIIHLFTKLALYLASNIIINNYNCELIFLNL